MDPDLISIAIATLAFTGGHFLLSSAPELKPDGFGSLKQALAHLSRIGTGREHLDASLFATHRKSGRMTSIPVTPGVRVNNLAAA